MKAVFFKFWRRFSFFFVLAILIYCYSILPDDVAVRHNEFGRPVGYVEKGTFFYVAGGVIVLFNLLMGLMKTATLEVDFLKLNPNSIWAKAKEALTDTLRNWFDGFTGTINTILVFILLGLNGVNRQVDQALDRDYSFVLLAAGIIVILAIFFLPLRLLFTNPSESR